MAIAALVIIKYQSDSVPISEMWSDFNALPAQFQKLHSDGHGSRDKTDYLIKLFENRFKSMYGKAHGLSSLLDPYVIEEDLSATKSAELENILIRTPMNDHISIGDTRRELLDLQVTAYYMMFAIKEQKDNSFQFKMFMNGCKTPLQ